MESRLTRDKGHLAQHDPTQGEIQVHLDIATDAMVQFDGDVTCMFHYCVWHVGEMDRLASEVLTADAEKYLGVDEDLERRRKKSKDNENQYMTFCKGWDGQDVRKNYVKETVLN